MTCKVTWLIPVLNGMPYLSEMLASIEAQTYKNWEVLVWDNGSTDGTLQELEKWIPNRIPGRVITGEPHGVGGSLRRLVEECKTELCARIDADDINLPERLEHQLNFLSSHSNIGVLGTWMYFIDEIGIQEENLYTVPLSHNDIVHEMLVRNAIAHPSVVFKRSVVLRAGNYSELPNTEDFDLWLRISRDSKLANLETPLVKYRIHKKSETRLAIQNNYLNKAINECICKNAPFAFGCSESDMKLLREQKHPCAVRPLLQIANYLHQASEEKFIDRIRTPSFLESAKSLLSSRDIISRLYFSTLDPKKFAFYSELRNILKSALLKVLKISKFFYKIDKFRSKNIGGKNLYKWLKNLELRGSIVHPSIEITGADNPYDYIDIGENCEIQRDFTIWLSSDSGAKPFFNVKDNAYLGRNVYIGAYQPITIGEFTQIGAYSYIISGNHRYENRKIPIKEQGFVGKTIYIEEDVWIGTHVVILPGVTIGRGSIVAAHSLVNEDIPPYEIWGGMPAKFIKHRPQ
jgi:acetyltransferase-like isoleucine patch superfamily enzyme